MNRPPFIVFFGLFLLAGARSLGAQQINPRVPPPPPSAPAGARRPRPQLRPTPRLPPPRRQCLRRHPTFRSPSIRPFRRLLLRKIRRPRLRQRLLGLYSTRCTPEGAWILAGSILNKGSYDAAIDRFMEASNYQPTLAAPWKLLGDAYEKKHEYAKAVEAYNKYLQILPRAPDAAKIKKQISDLAEKIAQESPKKAER